MTFFRDYLPAGPIVLDASAIINVLGCGRTEEVFRGLGRECIVEERTLKEIVRHPIPEASHSQVIGNLADSGLLRIERMNSKEYEIYLDLIQGALPNRLGTGESASIAVSLSRRYGIILDDAKARRIYAALPGASVQNSSLKLFFSAAANMAWHKDRVLEIVVSARQYSRLSVPKERCPASQFSVALRLRGHRL